MVYLKIKKGKGFFLNKDNQMQEIHEIRKEDILRLLEIATDCNAEFKMDEYKDDNIQNEAHKIIYESIYNGFIELLNNKNRFIDESESLYKEALQKYQE